MHATAVMPFAATTTRAGAGVVEVEAGHRANEDLRFDNAAEKGFLAANRRELPVARGVARRMRPVAVTDTTGGKKEQGKGDGCDEA
jgi:hypothetical protein